MTSLRLRAICAAAAVPLLAAFEVACLRSSVATLSPHEFAERATDLSLSGPWRYGYVSGIHGARLVRTANLPDLVPSPHPTDLALTQRMRADLASLPRRAALEFAFYCVLLLYVVSAAPWLYGVLARRWPRRWQLRCARGLLAVSVAAIALLPQRLLGYGASAFSTYVGPGALSWSGGYPQITWLTADTISYRTFVEFLLIGPLWLFSKLPQLPFAGVRPPFWLQVLLEMVPQSLRPGNVEEALFWLFACGFFFIAGAMVPAGGRKVAAGV